MIALGMPQLSHVLLVLALVFLAWQFASSRTGKVDPASAKQLVQQGALLLDVRTPQEFQAGHLEGARNVPVGELSQRLDELGERETPVVVYCRSGARSSRAKKVLEASGFQRVSDLGAMSRW